jgi:hypothetical protein
VVVGLSVVVGLFEAVGSGHCKNQDTQSPDQKSANSFAFPAPFLLCTSMNLGSRSVNHLSWSSVVQERCPIFPPALAFLIFVTVNMGGIMVQTNHTNFLFYQRYANNITIKRTEITDMLHCVVTRCKVQGGSRDRLGKGVADRSA